MNKHIIHDPLWSKEQSSRDINTALRRTRSPPAAGIAHAHIADVLFKMQIIEGANPALYLRSEIDSHQFRQQNSDVFLGDFCGRICVKTYFNVVVRLIESAIEAFAFIRMNKVQSKIDASVMKDAAMRIGRSYRYFRQFLNDFFSRPFEASAHLLVFLLICIVFCNADINALIGNRHPRPISMLHIDHYQVLLVIDV